MSRTSPSKFIPKVPKVVPKKAGSRRRNAYPDATKTTLIDVAEELFSENGYAATSLDAIVAGAEVTKGALYHHFSGKLAVFEAVFERIDARCSVAIHDATSAESDPWAAATTGLRTFLEIAQRPSYRRVVLQDAPSVIGHERFREQSERSTYINVTEILDTVLSAGDWDVDAEMLDTFSQIFYGALSAAGGSIAQSDEPELAASRVEAAILFVLAGIEALASSGAPGPTTRPAG